MPITLPLEKICPVLSLAPRTMDLVGRQEAGFILCQGESCAWFRGKEDKVDGVCAITDTAGWLKNLHELAAAPGKQAKSKEPEDKPEEPEDDQDR